MTMTRFSGKVIRKEPEGYGVVRLDDLNAPSDIGLFTAKTHNLGRIWKQMEVGSSVSCEVDANDTATLKINHIELIGV